VKKRITAKTTKPNQKIALHLHAPFSCNELKSPSIVADALLNCVKSGDLEAFRDVLISHLLSTNKGELAKRAGIGRRTIYDLLDSKKKFNPELSTVSAD